MKLEIWKNDIIRAKLKPGLYFAESDGLMLRLVDKKTDIPVRIYSENGEFYADLPDSIVKELEIDGGWRLEIISPKDSGWDYIALIVV